MSDGRRITVVAFLRPITVLTAHGGEVMFMECSECAALVRKKGGSMEAHLAWHDQHDPKEGTNDH